MPTRSPGRGSAFSAPLRRHRAVEVSAPNAMSEAFAVSRSVRLPRGARIGRATAPGGQVIPILDVAEARRLDLPPLAPKGAARLAGGTGIGTTVTDPLGAWGNGDWAVNLPLALEVMGADPNVANVAFANNTADGRPTRPTD